MKKKLRLQLDDLAVSSFTTTRLETGTGTVRAHYSGECGSSGAMFCICDDTPGDNTFVNPTCATGQQAQCGCGLGG